MNVATLERAATVIRAESALSDDARALIEASQQALLQVFPPEEVFSFSAEELAGPNCQFLIARQNGRPVGCVALVDMIGYGEIKRLYLHPDARGHGIAKAMIATLEDLARHIGLPVLKLETGPDLAAAVSLYQASGYQVCAPFGGYPDLPSNLFMQKSMSAAAA